jgi:hypothetical protein
MVDVVQIGLRGSQYVADLGEGIELIWTPAEDGSDILSIPKLEAAPAGAAYLGLSADETG